MIFIDTGAIVARHRRSDAHHRAAVAGWKQLGRSSTRLFTTNLVLAEAVTLLARYVGVPPAAEQARILFESSELHVLRPPEQDELEAIDVMEKYKDHEISFVDCVSFVTLRQHGIKRVFGFDRHFEIAGFELWPRQR